MPEQSPPDLSRRLLHVYTSPDETVGEVGSRSLPQAAAKRRRAQPVEKFGPLTSIAIDEAVMNHARDLAGQDLARIVLRADGSVIVANSTEQARRVRKDPSFGAWPTPDAETHG
jgi:hypothetical protein